MSTNLDELRMMLRQAPERWDALMRTTPHALLIQAPQPGEWNALGCLQHLVDLEPIFHFRAQAILAGEAFPAVDPDAVGNAFTPNQDAAALLDQFRTLRAASLETVTAINPEDLSRIGTHAELGEVSLGQLLHEWAGHDLMHAVQAEHAIMQPFIEGCGPWRSYFADHDAGTSTGR